MTLPAESLSSALDTLQTIKAELRERFIERDAIIEGALAALIAGEHILLLGPVGTAKSMLALELCGRLTDANFFGWLLTKFSTPEELFGTISLSALERDEYQRVTTQKLPEAHIAFLDEIFKANSAILNSLLSLINERLYHNGATATQVPLLTLFAASNELPEEGELMALFDRFMLRYTVTYIKEDFRFLKMLSLPNDEEPREKTTLSLEALSTLRAGLAQVHLHDGYLGDIVDLRRRLRKKGIIASDRRYQKSITLLKAFALVDGRLAVEPDDLLQLQQVLWNEPEQQPEVLLTLQEVFNGHEEEGRTLLVQAREVRDFALRHRNDPERSMRANIEAHTKLKRILVRLNELVQDARTRRRDVSGVQEMIARVEQIQGRIFREMS